MSRSSNTSLRPCLKHSRTVTTTTTTDHDLDPLAASSAPASASAGASPTNPFPFALCSSVVGGPRVHFPPAPGLCQTHLTHSPSIYDRAPIVVLPNVCALPARNERTYTPSSSDYPSSPSHCHSHRKRRSSAIPGQGAALHPHAFRDAAGPPSSDPAHGWQQQQQQQYQQYQQQQQQQQQQLMPPLIPDFSSSESDESDGNNAPPDPMHFPSTGHPPISIVDGSGNEAALSFLPYANEREKPRKEHRGRSRSRVNPRSSMRSSEFALPELDGCLGGF
jgi:hypothetical protein